ncbi:MAG TPA: PAS domain S-box protein [Steroidobacteraceae bacterium]|nr:PAS domain S-box protein [Steroidobacteraceae bacterium]
MPSASRRGGSFVSFSEPIVLVSSDGTIDASNQSFAEQFGVAPEALVGRRLDALAAASASAIQEYLRACAASADVVQGSLILRQRADAIAMQARGIAYPPQAAPSASQVLLRLVATRDERGATAGATEHDARQWEQIEASLRRQSQILEVTLASIGDAVIVTDVQGRITFVNSVAATLTGWSAPEAQQRTLTEVFNIVSERTRAPLADPVAKVLQTGRIVGLANHTLLIARDGRDIPIDDSAAPIRLPNGELFGVVLVFRDITEQRRSEHARAWLAAIIECSDDAIISKTLAGSITSWNPGAVRLFGYAPEEIIGKPITTIVPPERLHEESEVLERLRRGERVEHFETVRLRKDGTRVDVSLSVSPVRDEHGEIVGASKIARDITERKRSERVLREADQRKDEFLATLAHELRNPLGAMRSAVEMLSDNGHASAQRQTAAEILTRQMHQMKRLVDDLLDVSRIGAGRVELQPELIDLGALLRGVEASLRASFESAHQELSVRLPQDTLWVHGDRTRLVQIFANLLHNANKYTPEGGRITAHLAREGAEAVIRIVDTGIGIPAGMEAQLFELFKQVERSRRRSNDGLGIGLALAKRLVDLHNGRIEAHSEGEDRGSEFTVRLPLAAPPAEAASGSAGESLSQDRAPRRILIADDNKDAATSLGMLLELMGHTTRVVHDGFEAVAAAEELRPEVVILDLGMPRMDGYEAARRIAAQPWANGVLLVALTGWGQPADRARAAEAGFHEHLVKPVEPDELRGVLANMRPRAQE